MFLFFNVQVIEYMEFIFSATVENTLCHIRSYQNTIDPAETVSQRPHKHFYIEFHSVFSGEEIVTLPDSKQTLHLRPGSVLMLPRGVYHGATTNGKTTERLCFNFSIDNVTGDDSELASICRRITAPALIEDAQIYNYLQQCRQLRKLPASSLSHTRQGMLLLNVALSVFDMLSPELDDRHEEKCKRQKWIIEEYIEHHFADDCGIEGLAGELYLSTRQTRKLVHKFLGEDYKSIVIRRRMELAEIYLRDGEKSLEEIAWQVGYRSYSGFQLCFKRHFGKTPSQFREKETD